MTNGTTTLSQLPMQKKYGTSWNHKPVNNKIRRIIIGFAVYIVSVSIGLANASAAIPTTKIAATIRNAVSNEPEES